MKKEIRCTAVEIDGSYANVRIGGCWYRTSRVVNYSPRLKFLETEHTVYRFK